MVRLAYVTTHPIQYQAPLFRRLAARGDVELRVFFTWHAGESSTFDPGFGRSVQWDVPLTAGYDWQLVANASPSPRVERFWGVVTPSLGRSLVDWAPDVVVVHGYAHAAEHQAMHACSRAAIPVLLRGESNLLPQRPVYKRALKRLGAELVRRRVAGAVCIGTLNRRYYEHYGFGGDRLFFAPYVVDDEFFAGQAGPAAERAAQWRAELGIPPDATVVGFAAKLSAVKDCATLVEAFGRVAKGNVALAIVGDGPLRADLERRASRYPDACIRFAGFANQRQMPAAYALCDVFALPSVFEPWGLAINEAMNLSRPVIVSDQVGCAPDLVAADNGWTFPAGDVDALAAILAQALASRPRLADMGRASVARIAGWGMEQAVQGFVHAAQAVKKVQP